MDKIKNKNNSFLALYFKIWLSFILVTILLSAIYLGMGYQISKSNYIKNLVIQDAYEVTRNGDYINNQNNFRDIKFGLANTADNGCGWISLYNVGIYFEKGWRPADIIKELDKNSTTAFGFLGTGIHGIMSYLNNNGFDAKIYFSKNGFENKMKNADAGVIGYVSLSSGHFQFLEKLTNVSEGENTYKFYNYQKRYTMNEYFEYNSDAFFWFLITINEK